MRTMHLFAGAGGGLLADLILGHTPLVAVEREPYACDVLRQRAKEGWFPELSVWEGDVRMFDPSEYIGKVDCLHAGFPCQDISTAGKQAGLAEGTRSGLYREVLRIARILGSKFIYLENVAAITSKGLEKIVKDLAEMGYDSRWCCLRASDVGAPHHRDRWWLLANSVSTGQQRQRESVNALYSTQTLNGKAVDAIDGSKPVFWSVEPAVGRVANGVAYRMDRLKAIGNGQVPLQAAVAFKILSEGWIDATP